MVGNAAHVISGTNATPGWYEIISVVVGVSITVDRNWGTGAVANGVVNIGGALSLGSSDDAVFESMVAGNIVHVKSGTYTLGGAVTISVAGGAQQPIKVMGYATTRGDSPKGSTRPIFDAGSTAFTVGQAWHWSNLVFTSTVAGNTVSSASNNVFMYCKFINRATSAARNAILLGTDNLLFCCEAISYRGNAVSNTGNNTFDLIFCVLHDSDAGFSGAGSASNGRFIGCIVHSCVTYGLRFTASTANNFIQNCTLFGRSDVGVGVSIATGVTDIRILNSIIHDWASGVVHADVQSVGIDDYNNYFSNTTDVTNWTKGANDLAVNPTYSSVSVVTVTTATTSNTGNTLTKAGATFITSGVVAGRDYVYISAGAGATAGIYGILSVDSETQLTLDLAPGNSTGDVTAAITTGQNFAITNTSLKAAGYAGAMPGGYTTSYLDIGAAQRLEDYPAAADVRNGVTYGNGSLTGTYTPATGGAQPPTSLGRYNWLS